MPKPTKATPLFISEDEYHAFLDDVTPDQLEDLSTLTDDVGLKTYLDDLYETSKAVLDYMGRLEFSESAVRKVARLVAQLDDFDCAYEERLETNHELSSALSAILRKVPRTLREQIDEYDFDDLPPIVPMHRYLYLATQYAQNINSTFAREIQGVPLEKIDFVKSNELECILYVLNGIFSGDVQDDDDVKNDPILSITHSTVDKLKKINGKLRPKSAKHKKTQA